MRRLRDMHTPKLKYMGSKRAMLQNGLGELLDYEVKSASRFVDLFTGSGAVAIHVAQRFPIPVIAVDLQKYSAILASAVVGRQRHIGWEVIWDKWEALAADTCAAYGPPNYETLNHDLVLEHRSWCVQQDDLPVTKAYGGHYFSPYQAVWIDALRFHMPKKRNLRTVAHAALIQAASQCVAAPGHTAQPFQPTSSALPYLCEAWNRDVVVRTKQSFSELADTCAKQRGAGEVHDANSYAKRLRKSDLVFIDPPYSGVHYSRFYHVLETIAQGECGVVSGVGRYPDPTLRPRSRYSLKTESANAINELLQTISSRGAKAILTFPDHECSNGLSGDDVRKIAKQHFSINEQIVSSKFSTLGGNNGNGEKSPARAARHHAKELIMVLQPR